MSPLALYIEQVYDHDVVSPGSNPKIVLYPPAPPNNSIFGSLRSAPTLNKTEMNRILFYPGSFNPPHRGHLHLLKHVFTRGTHDLNVIAAIILPRSNESVRKKVNDEQGLFRFGRDERCLLWKQDVCFPPWAWVYEKSTTSFPGFLARLIQETQKDGFSIEFLTLYGAGIGSPESPPSPVLGCKTIIMSDVARAADFQRSSGRMKDFEGCTKWRRISVNEDELRRRAKAKVNDAMLGINVFPPEARRILEDGMYGITPFALHSSRLRRPIIGPEYVEKTTETAVTQAIEDLKAVLTCQRNVNGQMITLRFVKCGEKERRKKFNDISSSDIRKIMHKRHGAKLKAALDWMALSAEVLWVYQNLWIDEARLGTGLLVKFLDFTEEFMLSEDSSSDEGTTPNEIPPSLEDLGLVKAIEKSPSISKQLPTSPPPIPKPPSLNNPIQPNPSPSFEKLEPRSPKNHQTQPPPEPQNPNERKRRFSETGLEAEREVLDPN